LRIIYPRSASAAVFSMVLLLQNRYSIPMHLRARH
jgi:hypothetical protein